ncbi:MAG: Fic family protein [Halioglobus sp.]|nr:Fic family protein [Halioglobus sp.]
MEGNTAGFRKTPGTVLKNQQSHEVVYTPPSPESIAGLMGGLEVFIHAESPLDPLVKMALIHHQFETIHPFYDGNGRTGRIVNILYLVKEQLLDTPILYLSRYISQTRTQYYHGLQQVRDHQEWEPWLVYMLRGVATTARHTTRLVESIAGLLQRHKQEIRGRYRFYSQDLLNNIFRHPYTKVAFLERDLKVSRATATRYLDALARDGILDQASPGEGKLLHQSRTGEPAVQSAGTGGGRRMTLGGHQQICFKPRAQFAVSGGLAVIPPEGNPYPSVIYMIDNQVDDMTVEEKLQVMETIWDDLSQHANEMPPPAWHGEVLAEREAAIDRGEESFNDWDVAKQRIEQEIK